MIKLHMVDSEAETEKAFDQHDDMMKFLKDYIQDAMVTEDRCVLRLEVTED